MTAVDGITGADIELTKDLGQWVAGFKADDIPEHSYTWAKHAILDILGVSIAGTREPLAAMLYDEFTEAGGSDCTVVGRNLRASTLNTALINGTLAHALDYDDVNGRLHGHPTAVTAPVALALGEALNSTGRDVLAAFIVGTEVGCLLGEMAGDGHYDLGFHSTGTMGTFAAAAVASHLMGLDAEKTTQALGIAASQASGLKANFGTMTKPLHAGKACMNGLLSARLAARGFTSHDDAIESHQGFAHTQAPEFEAQPVRPDPAQPLGIDQTLFKYHAACYLTHSSIEAIKELKAEHGIGLADMEAMQLYVANGHKDVCDIPEPDTGLEIKFGIRHLCCMALEGENTAALETYSDDNAVEPRYMSGRKLVSLEPGEASAPRHGATVKITLKDGRELTAKANVGVPATDLDNQWSKLSEKFEALTTPILGAEKSERLRAAVATMDNAADVRGLMQMVAG